MIVPVDGEFRLDKEADTARLGAAIARELKRREAVCVSGPPGAGKSTLARALIEALAGAGAATRRPALAQTYDTPGFPLAHFDLHRIGRPEDALGLDAALEAGAVVIEWAEKLGHHLPADRLDVELHVDGDRRRARLRAHGAWEGRALEF
jgi:tRNA threonylcarbamoyladenosine biosynthesis protein TsaE